jgi:putative transposase
MTLTQGNLYHVFNRGNNREPIFFSPQNYAFFIRKIRDHLVPICDILAWCLMPNHFHFLIYAGSRSVRRAPDRGLPRQQFSKAIQVLLSSYAQGVNQWTGRTGSIFQQKTKAINVTERGPAGADTVFHYIHQNPWKAGLVSRIEDWPYSSFSEYIEGEDDGLSKRELAAEMLDVNFNAFYKESYKMIRDYRETNDRRR